MIDKFLKTAGVDNMEDFYKLHPTEEHFFKTYPHMKNEMKKGKRIRRAQKGGVMPNSLGHSNPPIDYHSQTAANKMHFQSGGINPNTLRPASPAMNLNYRSGTYAPAKLRMQEGGEPQQEMMQQVMQMISAALEQGAEPKQIMQMLVQQGVPEEAAQQLMQMVMQQQSIPIKPIGYEMRPDNYMGKNEEDYKYSYANGGYYQNGGVNTLTNPQYADIATPPVPPASEWPYSPSLGMMHPITDPYALVVDRDGKETYVGAPKIPNTDAQDPYYRKMHPGSRSVEGYGYADGGKLPREILRSRLESHMSPAEADDYLSTYAQGGIHIDPAKRGTFRAQATRMGMSVKEAARHIMANKENYSPAMVKKAVFAHNFAKQNGGYTYQEGGETMGQEQMEAAPEQMQEQAMGQEQQQGGQDQMMQQLMQMVMQALQQGMQPEQIIQMLVQQGVPQDVATQVVQMVMQQAQGGAPQGGPGQQYQSQGAEYQGPQPQAAYGGMYQIGGVTAQGAGTHGQQYTIRNGVAVPMGAYGGYYADGGFFNESYMPFDY